VTAFITPIQAAEDDHVGISSKIFSIRWFTPITEIQICGHATLASAHVLFSTAGLLPDSVNLIKFKTVKTGVLTAKKVRVEGIPDRIELDFPAGELENGVDEGLEIEIKATVRRALGQEGAVKFVGVGSGASFQGIALVELHSDVLLEGMEMNGNVFSGLPSPLTSVILTSSSTGSDGTHFISRFFAPKIGIPEDSATGSSHCILGTYWAKKLVSEGKFKNGSGEELRAKQVSPRTGRVDVVWEEKTGRCLLRGEAVIVAKGEIYL